MKILFVAPSRDLRYAGPEIQTVINLLHPEILLDDGATIDALLEKLKGGYDLLWFAGHSGDDGLEMSDGILSADVLTQFLLDEGTALFLNSCSSLLVALHVNQELRSDVIATIGDVEDIRAYQTGVLFARMLAKGYGLRRAFDESNTSFSQYVFLPGISEGSDVVDVMRGELDLMRFMIEDLENRRAEQWATYRTESDVRYHPRLDEASARQWGFGFFVFTANMILFYSDVRHLIGMSWILAVMFGLISLPISGYFFMTGMKMSPRRRLAKGAFVALIVLLQILVLII